MTQFTRVRVNPRRRHARHALASLERLHAIIARSVESGRAGTQRPLWRLDKARGGATLQLYIVSETTPDPTVLRTELDAGAEDIASCAYEPFLNRLNIGQEWAFRLKANPTKSLKNPDGMGRGARVGIWNAEEQLEWLDRRTCEYGFHLTINRLEVPEVAVREAGKVEFLRKGSIVTLSSAVYDGILAIDDPELVRGALLNGIGRAKGYGFGLLTLATLQSVQHSRPQGEDS
ncbi:type I-E CRISPR-associated protein Cas6/Cse3/CasE [Bifidobacterium samirii]|uniref:Type I-E CRISPR-associated protein Cas6/Cse3/CasE n=1 Tax=Bifidobacterium samirii TaxID=2306974 RepID=A0A430FE34_9BIFI|nr:type I-E CRISPR-associated protein Cas6/Cse3/CasE [Bifidobacterium samirii]RSX51077.1 type I-E CRISPR-associated protein Cas6/Cse3/CasE [Bifidobacterium samirii]